MTDGLKMAIRELGRMAHGLGLVHRTCPGCGKTFLTASCNGYELCPACEAESMAGPVVRASERS